MSTSNKLTYLNETKSKIKQAINIAGANITNEPFRVYSSKLYQQYLDIIKNGTSALYASMPKVPGTGTELSLKNTAEAPMVLELSASESTQDTTTGKNLFKMTAGTITGSNVVIETTKFAELTFNGTSSAALWIEINSSVIKTETSKKTTKFINLDTSKTYTLSLIPVSGTYTDNPISQWGVQVDENDTLKSGNNIANSITFTGGNGIYRMYFQIKTNMTFANAKFIVQLEEGSSATAPELYTNGASPNPDYPQNINVVTGNNSITIEDEDNTLSQTFPLSLGSFELAGIGEYKDKIFNNIPSNPLYDSNLVEGGWYKYKMIDKYIFTGNENFTSSGNYEGIYQFNTYVTNSKVTHEQNILYVISNYFKGSSWTNSWLKNNAVVVALGNGTIRFMTDKFTSTTDFANWLSQKYQNNEPVVICVVLNNPTTEQITDTTLISQLEAIKNAVSYDDETNISQTNANRPFIISASAIKNSME